MHKNKIARSQICTKPNLHKGTKFHQGTKLHKDDSAPRVNFAQVTFLHESKKCRTKINNRQKKKQKKEKSY